MKAVPALLAATLCAAQLCACTAASEDSPLYGVNWQVVALHTEPGMSGELPADAAGKVSVVFSGNLRSQQSQMTGMTMMTGCAPLKAEIESFEKTLELEQVEVGDAQDCVGGSRYIHDTLTGLLVPGVQLTLKQLSDTEATLTVESNAIDQPTLRIMAL